MSTGSAVGLSTDVRLLRSLKTVVPALNLNLIAPPSPVPGADEADPGEIRVVLLDADYPDTDALLKWLEPDRPIPAILMREDDGPMARSLRGASAFLAKPVDPNKLRAAIELVVLDWEMPADKELRPEGIPDRRVRAEVSAETELDRVLGPALAEIGIPAGIDEMPRPRLPLPRNPAPQPWPPRSRPEVAGPGALPKETETFFSSFGPAAPAASGDSKKRFLAVGLAVFMLAGAGYLVFGRKTARTVESLPAVSRPAADPRRDLDAERPSVPQSAAEPAAGSQRRVSVEKNEAPVAKNGSEPAPKPTRPAGEAPQNPAAVPVIPEIEPGQKTSAPETAAAQVERQTNPPAEAEKSASEPPAMTAPTAKPAPDKSAAETKETPEAASRPAPAKSGDLIALEAVDIAPVLHNSVDPVYPPRALRNKRTAKVTLRVLISEKGAILQAEPEPGGTDDPAFVNAALKAVRRWSYSPAYKNGAAVRVWKSLIIDFRIR